MEMWLCWLLDFPGSLGILFMNRRFLRWEKAPGAESGDGAVC